MMSKDNFMEIFHEGKVFKVLDADYTLRYKELSDRAGECEHYSKEIHLDLSAYDDAESYDRIDLFYLKTLRHELIHAFFFELGLEQYAQDEILADALAIKMPQLRQLMELI